MNRSAMRKEKLIADASEKQYSIFINAARRKENL